MAAHPRPGPNPPVLDAIYKAAGSLSTRLSGRRLVLARAAWLVLALPAVVLYTIGVWVEIGQLRGRCPQRLCVYGQIPPPVQRALASLHLSAGFFGGFEFARNVAFAVGFGVVAALLFWRRSRDPLALYIALALLLFALCSFAHGILLASLDVIGPGGRLPVALLGFVGEFTFSIFVVIFPDGRFVPRWTLLAAPLVVAVWWGPNIFFPGSPFDFGTWPRLAYFAGWAFILGTMVGLQVYRYRYVSTPTQRLQTKWVVYGFITAGIGYFAGQLVIFFFASTLASPRAILADLGGYTLAYASMLAIPVCIAIAILRHRLYDIDVLIRRTLIYGVVTSTLVAVYAITSIVLQAGFVALTSQGSAVATFASTLAIVALFTPVRSRVQRGVDRRFYRSRYDAARTAEVFAHALRSDVDLARVTDRLLTVVEETMHPSQVSLWLARQEEPSVSASPAADLAAPLRLPAPALVPSPAPPQT